MSIFDKDIIEKEPYGEYRETSILFIKRQFTYRFDLVRMLYEGHYEQFCIYINDKINGPINREYNQKHGVIKENISIIPIRTTAKCKYFKIYSRITTVDEYTFKLYSRCFCIKPNMFDTKHVVWEDEYEFI